MGNGKKQLFIQSPFGTQDKYMKKPTAFASAICLWFPCWRRHYDAVCVRAKYEIVKEIQASRSIEIKAEMNAMDEQRNAIEQQCNKLRYEQELLNKKKVEEVDVVVVSPEMKQSPNRVQQLERLKQLRMEQEKLEQSLLNEDEEQLIATNEGM